MHLDRLKFVHLFQMIMLITLLIQQNEDHNTKKIFFQRSIENERNQNTIARAILPAGVSIELRIFEPD